MLHEIAHIRQSDCDHINRWLTCPDMDLFVWLNDDMNDSVPARFQLSLNKRSKDRVISWHRQIGFRLCQLDPSETFPHRYKKHPC